MFSKEKTIVFTVDDFINRNALSHVEFTDKDGNPCLIQVLPDECGFSPRQDWDHLWTWVTTFNAGYSDRNGVPMAKEDKSKAGMPIWRRYYHCPEDYEDDNGKLDRQFLKENIVVPLSLYRHSGDSISIGSTHPMNCPWDSGCMGFAFLSFERIRQDYGWKRVTKARREKLIGYLRNEIEEMNAVNEGRVYGIQVMNMETEEEDSCWGFIVPYGSDYLKDACADMLHGWVENDMRHEIAGRLAA